MGELVATRYFVEYENNDGDVGVHFMCTDTRMITIMDSPTILINFTRNIDNTLTFDDRDTLNGCIDYIVGNLLTDSRLVVNIASVVKLIDEGYVVVSTNRSIYKNIMDDLMIEYGFEQAGADPDTIEYDCIDPEAKALLKEQSEQYL
ncbi:hypothetical protein QQX98_008405 [Neonectria punicea]|uniref:Uncharacterized protein n=1 Tax=Neonectria punicea TaxID=979145 RepID=A0ABR1GV70_9HYPO